MRLFVAIIFTALLVASAPALACSQPGHGPELVGFPKPDEVDVPTDAVFSFVSRLGAEAVPPERVTLLSESGVRVPVSTRIRFNHLEITPTGPLTPNTQYEISVIWQLAQPAGVAAQRGQLSFRTGAGPFQGEPAAPRPAIEHWALYSTHACDHDESEMRGSCIWLGDDDLYLIDEWYVQGSVKRDLYGYGQRQERECLPVQRRAPTGALSVVRLICRTDGKIFDLRSDTVGKDEYLGITCTRDGLEREGRWVRDFYDGHETALHHDPLANCSVAAGAAGSTGAGWPLLLLSGALSLRRGRARRRPTR